MSIARFVLFDIVRLLVHSFLSLHVLLTYLVVVFSEQFQSWPIGRVTVLY